MEKNNLHAEIIIERRNIEVILSRYWSAELGKIIEGKIPDELFVPQLPHLKIIEMLADWGIKISRGTVFRIRLSKKIKIST